LKMGPIRCPETSLRDYNSILLNIPEERRSHIPSYLWWCQTMTSWNLT
jgi:hypothetical protein